MAASKNRVIELRSSFITTLLGGLKPRFDLAESHLSISGASSQGKQPKRPSQGSPGPARKEWLLESFSHERSYTLLPTHQFVGKLERFLASVWCFFFLMWSISLIFLLFVFPLWTCRVMWCWLCVGNTAGFRRSEGDQVSRLYGTCSMEHVLLSKWPWEVLLIF